MPPRIHTIHPRPERRDGDYVLYWMIAARRTRHSPALDHAIEVARRLDRPLLIFEPLRADHRWASARIHRFVLDGMRAQRDALEGSGIGYYPWVEPSPGAGRGLLEALAARACVVVTDTWPCFFLPRMVASAASRLEVPVVEVDGVGLVPLRLPGRSFGRASAFRRHVQKMVRQVLAHAPATAPLDTHGLPPLVDLPSSVTSRWPMASDALLDGTDLAAFEALPIDHGVPPVPMTGGAVAATRQLETFVDGALARYAEDRNHPDAEGSSGLSPWLHFGHIGVHEILDAVFSREGWSPARLSEEANGARTGFWGLSPDAEAFVDELITWRELGHLFCFHHPDLYHRYEAVPAWARRSLAEHAGDPRHPLTFEALEEARTPDPLWNAAQRQLREQGVIHNALRMLWGKKVLEWTTTPEEAFHWLVELNNRWAIDGRDPNSWTGILWTLGAFDRAWGPERPIFGKVRFMTSDSARRKLRLRRWLQRWS